MNGDHIDQIICDYYVGNGIRWMLAGVVLGIAVLALCGC